MDREECVRSSEVHFLFIRIGVEREFPTLKVQKIKEIRETQRTEQDSKSVMGSHISSSEMEGVRNELMWAETQGHFFSTMPRPVSSYSCFDTHI